MVPGNSFLLLFHFLEVSIDFRKRDLELFVGQRGEFASDIDRASASARIRIVQIPVRAVRPVLSIAATEATLASAIAVAFDKAYRVAIRAGAKNPHGFAFTNLLDIFPLRHTP